MIPLPKKPKVTKQSENGAVFEIEALYPGYGVTVGNSLRRTLLSSLEGSAVTQLSIKGVAHEFSTIPGVKEDVIQIMLNLKKLHFKVFSEEPQTASLKVKGEKEVKGSDLEMPTQLELVNKDAPIATITDKKASLEMEIQIEKGVGYASKESRKKDKLEVGVILMDAVFTPVRNVSFKVENMRVGKRTDFDKLFLTVKTDGTISPQEAFSKSSEILRKHFDLLFQAFGKEEGVSKPEGVYLSGKGIKELGLSEGLEKILSKSGIKTIGELSGKSENDIKKMKGVGKKSVEKIKKSLQNLGFSFKK